MRKITYYLTVVLVCFFMQESFAQEFDYKREINILEISKKDIQQSEKEALKKAVMAINEQLKAGEITADEAKALKLEAAKKHALNIENRIAIIDAQISLLQTNKRYEAIAEYRKSEAASRLKLGPWIDIATDDWKKKKEKLKYDRRTYSDLVLALGFNNALIEGQSLNDTPYQIGGSRFFEMGWAWRTRVFKNTNFLRFNYGFSFQFNGLKPKNNTYFVMNEDGDVNVETFEFDLNKSKFRMDNLVFPMHFEIGPSKLHKTEHAMRYSLKHKFRFGFGGYGGVNLGARQKLKYISDGKRVKDKLKGGYNTNSFVYGLSAYAGFDGVLLYMKYDLNPIFKNAAVEQRNISLGLRFDL